jgi:Replication initiator protein, pSAM2
MGRAHTSSAAAGTAKQPYYPVEIAGSKDAARCIGYLTKYLTKQVGDCHHAETDAQLADTARLAEALRYQPCSPTCANWLR